MPAPAEEAPKLKDYPELRGWKESPALEAAAVGYESKSLLAGLRVEVHGFTRVFRRQRQVDL